MNFWNENQNFWGDREKKYGVYTEIKREVAEEIAEMALKYNFERVLEIGGYKGELGKYLPPELEYVNLDFATGFNLLEDWEKQGLQPSNKKTLGVSLITLIAFPLDEARQVLDQLKSKTEGLLLMEEIYDPLLPRDQKTTDEYGGKWNLMIKTMEPWDDRKISRTNFKWEKFYKFPEKKE